MLSLSQTLIIAVILAAFGGETALFLLKKLLISPKSMFSFEVSGMIERPALAVVIILGGPSLLLIPFIVMIRAVFLLWKANLIGLANILKREEPAVEFQRIRLKSELSLSLISSPFLGIMSGLLASIL